MVGIQMPRDLFEPIPENGSKHFLNECLHHFLSKKLDCGFKAALLSHGHFLLQ